MNTLNSRANWACENVFSFLFNWNQKYFELIDSKLQMLFIKPVRANSVHIHFCRLSWTRSSTDQWMSIEMFTEQTDWLIYAPDCSAFIDHASQNHCNQHGISIILHMGLFFIHWLHLLNCIFLQGLGWIFMNSRKHVTPLWRDAAEQLNQEIRMPCYGVLPQLQQSLFSLHSCIKTVCSTSWGSLTWTLYIPYNVYKVTP